jgi:FdhE protein
LTEAVAELDRLVQARPSLQVSAAVLREMLPALFQQSAEEVPLSLTPEAARTKLAEGVPLLRRESLALDYVSFLGRWLALCQVVERHPGGEPAAALALAARQEVLDPVALLGEVLAGGAEAVAAQVEALQLDPALTLTTLRLSAFPVLSRVGTALAAWRREAAWERGNCPTCGSWPLLGEFRGLEQVRVLRCGLCATAWDFPRLRCPFCDTRDHRQLGFLHAEGEQDRYRAATCDACRGYVKMVSTLSALSGPLLLVTDLATLHLDLVAADRGFFVP